MKLFILLTIHNEYDYLFKVLDMLNNQQNCDQSTINIFIIDSSSKNQVNINNFIENKYKSLHIQYRKVPNHFFWSKMNNFGLKEISKISSEFDLVLFMNVDVKIQEDFISKIFLLYSEDRNFILSACISDDDSPEFKCGVRITKRNLKIKDNIVSKYLLQDEYVAVKSSAVSTRATVYPASLFQSHLKIRYWLFPHYFADLVLGFEAQSLGFDIKFHSAFHISNTRLPSVSKLNRNFVARYFYKSSPSRLISILFFWTVIFKLDLLKFFKSKFLRL
jgi:GT2 family glycosyltransferase